MNLFENLGEAIKETIENTVEKASEINISKGSNIKNEEIELAQKLDAVEEFSVDVVFSVVPSVATFSVT